MGILPIVQSPGFLFGVDGGYPTGDLSPIGKKEGEVLREENKPPVDQPGSKVEESKWKQFLKALMQALGAPHT